MIGFGAIVKSAIGHLDAAISAAVLGLRVALGARRPKPCPIPIPVEAKPRRR